MRVTLIPVDNHQLLKKYIFLPQALYKRDTRWVPPLYADEWDFHNPQKNKALSYCDTVKVLAYQQDKLVGRIMGIIHHPYNAHHHEKTARFFQLDCINDPHVSHALIHYIEQWGKSKGMKKIIGPFGFSDKDPQGLQIKGFEYLPVIATPTNPPYLIELVEKEGYKKEVDCVSYQMDITPLPRAYETIHERIVKNNAHRLIEFKSKAQLKPYILPVLQLVNEAYAPIFGFVPMTEEEMKKFAAQYLPILDPEFVKVVVNEAGVVIAFVVAMPDMSKGIQKAKGKLFPFGFIHILLSMRKSTQLDLLLGAIKQGYRRKGINILMGKAMMASAIKRNLKIMDSHLILENNLPMRGECEKLNGRICKQYRVYRKTLE